MNYFKLCDMGFEHMASVATYDDAYEMAEDFMESGYYDTYAITPYKGSPGKEDAYAVLMLDKLGKLKILEDLWKSGQ